MVNSSFDYSPGLIIMHSRDLVHWEPIGAAVKGYIGSIWAPDICKYNGKYYIYFTVNKSRTTNYVITADSPYGPWSEPKDLGIGQIDPCHVADEQGHRWLFLSGGYRIRLSDDGLSVDRSTFEHVYDGWKFPSSWVTEGFALEGPKIKRIGNYYYYISAEGGTSGAPTSHMVVVARSKSIDGPWENMPANPIIHTYSATEKWWSRGHGSLIDTPDGHWYIMYHAYENGFYNLGRQTMINPVELTADGWLKSDIRDTNIVALPESNPSSYNKVEHLSKFRIGKEWKGFKNFDLSRITINNNMLTLNAKGDDPASSSPLLFVSGEHAYELSAKVEIKGDVTAGLTMFYNETHYVGTGSNGKSRLCWRMGGIRGSNKFEHTTFWLKMRNDHHVVTGYYSIDGKHWEKETWGMEVSGYNHNTLYYFQSLLPGLFAYGKDGKATFSDFTYKVLRNENETSVMSGVPWFDDEGHVVNAHGACIVNDKEKYYLFGEWKSDTTNTFPGFSCYSSTDMVKWHFERVAFPRQSVGLMGPNRVGERVKVMHCPSTGEYVMFMHSDDMGYKDPHTCYATSKTIDGEYIFRGPLLYKGQPIQRWDIGTFQDTDGRGYLLVHHGQIYELSADYHSAIRLLPHIEGMGESPAMFKKRGIYYLLTSNLTSWEKNDNYYFTANNINGPWTKRGNFCPKGTLTYNSQTTFVQPMVHNGDTIPIFMGDRWSYPHQASSATYIWQPLQVDGTNLAIPSFAPAWDINTVKSVTPLQGFHALLLFDIESDAYWNRTDTLLQSNHPNAELSLDFTGSQAAIIGDLSSHGGYARITINDSIGKEVSSLLIDFYSQIFDSGIRYVSPILPFGKYHLKLTVTGEHPKWNDKQKNNYGSDDNYIKVREVKVL